MSSRNWDAAGLAMMTGVPMEDREIVRRDMVVKRLNFVAKGGKAYAADTTTAAITMLLPKRPYDGQWVEVRDPLGSWSTNNLTVDARNNTIVLADAAAATTVTMALPGTYIFMWDRTNHIWRVFSTATQIAALAGNRTDIAAGSTTMVPGGRYRITGTATAAMPTYKKGQWNIVEFGAADGLTQTVGRNAQTIDGVAADDTSTLKGAIVLYYCDSAGAVVSKKIGQLPA